VPRNDEEGFKWFRLAAAQGHADAQYNLGLIYKDGRGRDKNFVEAYKWFNLSAARGHVNAGMRMETVGRLMSREQVAEAQRTAATFTTEQPVERFIEKPSRKGEKEPMFGPVPPPSGTNP
jgi:TPR repeat protein